MKKRENYKLIRCTDAVTVIVTVRNIGNIGHVYRNSIRRSYSYPIPKYIIQEAREMLSKTADIECANCNNCGIRTGRGWKSLTEKE